MESKELRLNNLISYEGKAWRVSKIAETGERISVCFDYHQKNGLPIKKTNPIPLNEDWFVKFNFKCVHEKNKHYNIVHPKGYKDNYTINFVPTLNEQWTLCFHDLTVNQSYITCTHIKHVHQLQNLYFALTGTEL